MEEKQEDRSMADNKRIDLYFNMSYQDQKNLYDRLVSLKASMGITYTQAVLVITGLEQAQKSFNKLSEEYEKLKIRFEEKESQLIKLRTQMADRYFNEENRMEEPKGEGGTNMAAGTLEIKETLVQPENNEKAKKEIDAEDEFLYS